MMSPSPESLERSLSPAPHLKALHETHLLDTPPEEDFDRLTRLARRLLDAPVGLLSLVDEDRQFFKSACGLPDPWASRRETPLSHSFCRHVVSRDAPLMVEDARNHPLLANNRAIRDLSIVAYLGVPVRTPEGKAIGSFCVIDTKPRTWSTEDADQMQTLATSVKTEIALRTKTEALERKQRELAAAKAFGATALDMLPDLFFVIDDEARFIKWNRRMCEVTGYANEEIQAMRATDLFDEQDATRIKKALSRAPQDGLPPIEARLVTKTGTAIPYEFNSRELRNEQGHLIGICGIGRNVSEHRRNEEALYQSEMRFRSFVEATSQVVWWADEAGRVTEISETWQTFTGQSAKEVAGWGWADALHPEDRPRVAATWTEHLKNRETFETEYRVQRYDGTYHWFAVRAVPVTYSDNAPTEWIGTCTNIEKRRQTERALVESEERLRLALGAAEMGTWDHDVETGRTHWSPEAEAIFGLKPGAFDGTKASFYALLHPADRPRVRRRTEQTIATAENGTILDMEYRIQRPEGQLRWMRSTGRLYRDEDGQPCRMIGTVVDVTDRHNHEQRLLKAKERAEEMSRLKDAFLSNMSHEIRTPLTWIIGYADLLIDEVPEAAQEMATMIREGGDRLLETLNSVLDLAQLESGELKLDPVRLDVAQEVRGVIGLFEQRAREQDLTLQFVAPHGPAPVHVDRGALRRVLTNLVSNAIKFTPQGGVTIRIEQTSDEVIVSVEDTGVGIGEDFLPELFEAFRQESSGLTRAFEGSGLGLTIAQHLTHLMDGRIEVESQKNKGAIFRLHLPAPPNKDAFASTTEEPTRLDAQHCAPRILLVEDSVETPKVTKRMLSDVATVDTVAIDETALTEVAANGYDLVLLDIRLGSSLDSIETLAALREMPACRDVPVAALTAAQAMSGEQKHLLTEGVDAYLSKPFKKHDLLDLVGALMRNKRL